MRPLLLLLILETLRAQVPADMARDLVRRIGPVARETVTVSFRNQSDLSAAESADIRRIFESELRQQGARVVESAGSVDVRLTIAQNLANYLLVAEVRRGEDRQVSMLPWPRVPNSARAGATAVSIEKTLLLEQREQILDIASIGGSLLVLQPSRITRGAQSATLPARTWPRDMRGRLLVQSGSFLAYLPGLICSGVLDPLDVRCREGDEPWPGELRAYLAANRNFFDGRVSLASGVRKSLTPFYSAAPLGDGWAITGIDGQVRLYDAALEPAGQLSGWGSDVASAKCGEAALLLASTAGEATDKDAIHVLRLENRQASETGAAIEMPGPVTALWPGGNGGAIAVAHNFVSGAYAAFRLSISCGH